MTRLAEGVCDAEEEAKCREEHLEYLDRACARCRKIRADQIEPYTRHLLRLHGLVKAGYRPDRDELSLKEWGDLALVTEVLETIRERKRWPPPKP